LLKILAMPFSKTLYLSVVLSILAFTASAQLIKDKAVLENMYVSLAKQKMLSKGRTHQLFDIFNKPMKPDERLALEYLYAYLPLSDLADYNGEYFSEEVRKTIQAMNEMPWGSKIPEDIFLHFVLPIRVNNENLDNFRVDMYDELKDCIKGLDMHDAALEINRWCHRKVTYRGSDERTSSPLASVKTSFGRCGEESTFTVASMRAMGIPARQVYTPRWAHCDDNHAWVEVWVDGKWNFLGACEPEAELNMGWFAAPAMRAMLVHTRAYGWYKGNEEVIDRQDKFSELNLIGKYAEAKTVFVRVLDENGKPANDAKVEYQLYNSAEFYPIAKGNTDSLGLSSIRTGLGDLLIWATKGGAWTYHKMTVENTDTLELRLSGTHEPTFAENFDLVPPVEKIPPENNLPPEAMLRNSKMLQLEDSIRFVYMSTFKDSAWAVSFAEKNGINPELSVSFFKSSYGNWKEIASFLETATPAERPWAISLLGTISDKDFRDTRSEILFDHLRNSVPFPSISKYPDTGFFASYVMSGRIANEMMLPWRGFLKQQFTVEFENEVKKDIHVLIYWINKNISINDTNNLHSRAPLSPRGVYELRFSDRHSRDIFFVAVCRCFGIPARINPATKMIQYWKEGNWQNVEFDAVKENINKPGMIHFINDNPNFEPKYGINFTIARFSNGVFRTLGFEYGRELKEMQGKIAVEAGKYYLVTGNRQADGSVLSSLTFFNVLEGKTTDVNVKVRESFVHVEPWSKVDLKAYPLEKYNTNEKVLASVVSGVNGSIFIWIDPEKEPSKHIMADMPAVTSLLEKWNGGLVFLLQKENLSNSFNPGDFRNLPSQHFYAYDRNSKFIKEISRLKGHSLLNNLPLIVISDAKGNLVYFSEGYKIGIGEQIAKEISRLK
jgi:hypothetical protein